MSPHCDAKRKHGSHLFYFNTSRDWDTAWGGQTRVLDDGGCLAHAANPECEDLGCVAPHRRWGTTACCSREANIPGTAYEELRCPEGHMRKVFIVVVNRLTPALRMQRLFGDLPKGY